MARTVTVSDFALKLDHSLRIGSNVHMITIDQFLAPVRECLEGLKHGNDCWCEIMNDGLTRFEAFKKHDTACLAAQAMWESLKN